MQARTDGRRGHLLVLGCIACLIALLYARLTGAWFCGYDDFNEAHRAAFDDAVSPVRMLTTTHNTPYMYRPVTSALQLFTWEVSDRSPLAFRVRNLAMHLVCVVMLYGIVLLLAGSRLVAAGAALLFGVEPLANETVGIAIWTNTTAYAFFFTSFFLLLYSLNRAKAGKRWGIALGGSFLCAFVAIFTYEPTIVIFALIPAYLWLWKSRGLPVQAPYLRWVVSGILFETAVFFAARHLVISHAAAFNPVAVVVRNAGLYAVALLTPVDAVLANALFGTPLPSSVGLKPSAAIPALAGVALVLVGAALALRADPVKKALSRVDGRLAAFVIVAIPLCVLPLLLFREHPSEHDLYPSAAFYTASVCLLLWQLTRSRAVYGALVLLLAASFAAGTYVRNERIESCAAIAHRIVAQLPVARWQRGYWHILLATPPGEALGQPYGAYNDYGVHVLETKEGLTAGAMYALRLASGNDRIEADVVDAAAVSRCEKTSTCFWVTRGGGVTDAALAARRAFR